jgi:predicted RecA/RadA family phage recombinase
MYWKVRPKKRISVGLSANVAALNVVKQGGFVGIPMFHALSGESVTLGLDGEISGLTFSGQGTVAAGSYIYWDTSASALSLGADNDDYLIGKVTVAKDANNEFDMLQLMPVGPGMNGGGQ